MKNISKGYIFLGLLAVATLVNYWFSSHQPVPFQPKEVAKTDALSDRNIIKIRVDSLTKIIKLVYGNDATISLPDSAFYQIKVKNQGNEITNFYNDNPRLLEVKDNRFSIKHTGNIVEASFKIETSNRQKYAFVPTDVVYKLSELAYN